MKKTLILPNQASFNLYETPQNDRFILYLHGGGLIYGSKNDLPSDLKNRFLDKGYSVIALDYRLAPNSSLEEILDNLEDSFRLLLTTVIHDQPFGICGRSAGGFLMFQLTKRLLSSEKAPLFLINFYGYTDLLFIDQDRSLLSQKIDASQLEQNDLKQITWDDPFLTRYVLYHYAVQQKLLPRYYGIHSLEDFALTNDVLQTFPKTFSTASSSDQEVPFRYSKMIGRSIPASLFAPVYYLPHDFLKESEKPEVQAVLDKLEKWLP